MMTLDSESTEVEQYCPLKWSQSDSLKKRRLQAITGSHPPKMPCKSMLSKPL